MDVYKYTIWTGNIPGSEPIDPCSRGSVNPTNTMTDCNCPPFVMATTPNGGYGALSTNFTGLFDPDRLSGITYNTGTSVWEATEPVSPLGGYRLGDVVLADHDAITPFNPRAGCLNEQGPHCFVYIQQDYNFTGYNYFTTPNGPAPWKSPTYPMDSPYYEPGVGIVGMPAGPQLYAGTGTGGGSYDGGPWVCCDSEDIFDITAHEGPDHQIPIFLDQDFNDIGFYTPFDGGIFQKDLFSNFTVTSDLSQSNAGYVITVTNSTPFGLYSDTQGFAFTIDWGDGAVQTVQYPTISMTHIYAFGVNSANITIQMVAPWGITAISQPVTLPYLTGSSVNIPNPNLSFTFNPPSGGAPVTQNWMYSTFGPLDSGTNVYDYVSANFAPVPIAVTGTTDSQLTNFQLYSTAPSNSPYLPNGYMLNQLVPLGGEIEMGLGDFQSTLFGEIITANNNFTAYTISDGGAGGNPVTMFDYQNGVTLFEVDTVGLNEYNLFTQSCEPVGLDDLEEDPDLCEFCIGIQNPPNSVSVQVTTNQGMWQTGTGYQVGDLVRFAGCCWFAGGTIPPMNNVPPNNIDAFEGGMQGTGVGYAPGLQGWWPCPGQVCEAADVFTGAEIDGCTDSTALNFNPLATNDDGSCVYNEDDWLGGGVTSDPDYGIDDDVDIGISTGGTGSNSTGTITSTAACCDPLANNTDPNCGQTGVFNDASLCTYPYATGGQWVCDPNNALELRCQADGGGNLTGLGCSAVEYPNEFNHIGNTPLMPTAYNAVTNCANAVPTPSQSEISDCTSTLGLPGLMNQVEFSTNSAGGRGTGCVRIDKAWHPRNTSYWSSPIGSYSDGVTDYGCMYPMNCFHWEYATYFAGLQSSASDPYYTSSNMYGFPAIPPGTFGRDLSGTLSSNNQINPVAELIDANSVMYTQVVYNSYCECMSVTDGCPSQVKNYVW